MIVLGVESSCDECSIALVEDGKKIISNVVATQIEFHKKYSGVVPEIASRKHTEWILDVFNRALKEAQMDFDAIDGIAVTNRPGLVGSLLVGVSFAKALAFSGNKPFIGIDHIQAHLYAPQLEYDIEYPFLGLLVSGGHTIICVVNDYDKMEVLGTTIDDACGEAFDKVAKYYDFGYPGGVLIDKMSKDGNDRAFDFPDPSLHKGEHRYDVSYSGLKTAVINQLDQFWNQEYEKTPENIAASFQRAAIEMLVKRLMKASADMGLKTIVAGGGVAANSYLRKVLIEKSGFTTIFPSMKLCTDNAAMIAGLGYQYLSRGIVSDLSLNANARVSGMRKTYP